MIGARPRSFGYCGFRFNAGLIDIVDGRHALSLISASPTLRGHVYTAHFHYETGPAAMASTNCMALESATVFASTATSPSSSAFSLAAAQVIGKAAVLWILGGECPIMRLHRYASKRAARASQQQEQGFEIGRESKQEGLELG